MRPWHDSEGGITLSRAKGCLNLYNNLDQGMGSFFFLFVSMNQVAWIFYIFITISSLLGDNLDASSLSFSFSYCLGTLGLVLSVVSITLALDRCYQGLGMMASELRMKLTNMKEEEGSSRQKEEANIVLQELERRGPLSGLGFFTIERSTITGMLSTAVTYIIILVQFRMSTD